MSRNFSLSVDRHMNVFCRLMTKQGACSASLLRINKGTKNRLIAFRSYLLELNPSTGSWCSHACSCRCRVLYGLTLFSSFWSSLCAVAATSFHTLARSFKQASTSLYDGNKDSYAISLMVFRRVIMDSTSLSESPSVTKHSAGS